MTVYENTHFRIKVDFPASWTVRSETANPESKIQYQAVDDDLPTDNGDFRTLFLATRKVEGGPTIFSSKFSMVIHKHIDGYDVVDATKQKGDLLECNRDNLKILGHEAQTIKMVEIGDGYNLITKIIAWEESPEIWISIYLDGNSLENFLAAEEILKSLKRI